MLQYPYSSMRDEQARAKVGGVAFSGQNIPVNGTPQ